MCALSNINSLALGFSRPIQHTLKGILFQSEVGFLSLLEHYGFCTVSIRRACYVSLFIESTTKSLQNVISYQSMNDLVNVTLRYYHNFPWKKSNLHHA